MHHASCAEGCDDSFRYCTVYFPLYQRRGNFALERPAVPSSDPRTVLDRITARIRKQCPPPGFPRRALNCLPLRAPSFYHHLSFLAVPVTYTLYVFTNTFNMDATIMLDESVGAQGLSKLSREEGKGPCSATARGRTILVMSTLSASRSSRRICSAGHTGGSIVCAADLSVGHGRADRRVYARARSVCHHEYCQHCSWHCRSCRENTEGGRTRGLLRDGERYW